MQPAGSLRVHSLEFMQCPLIISCTIHLLRCCVDNKRITQLPAHVALPRLVLVVCTYHRFMINSVLDFVAVGFYVLSGCLRVQFSPWPLEQHGHVSSTCRKHCTAYSCKLNLLFSQCNYVRLVSATFRLVATLCEEHTYPAMPADQVNSQTVV